MDAPELLTIGRLARRGGLTAKALRHYDRIGLLVPAFVDDTTGVRHYTVDQVEPATLIARLRAVDLPLDDVRRCLAGSPAEIREILLTHRDRLTGRATRIAGDLHELAHLITDGVETTMTDHQTTEDVVTGDTERRLAAKLFNGVWTLLETENRSRDDDDRMLHMAHASRYHWGQVGAPRNLARGEWQCSRVYAVLHRPEPSLHHARRVLDICQEHGIADFDITFAYEALARAHAVAGDADTARTMTERALATVDGIAEDQDRAIVLADLETIPGQPRFW
jgi:DNA-binding transcriptional MerR regulator